MSRTSTSGPRSVLGILLALGAILAAASVMAVVWPAGGVGPPPERRSGDDAPAADRLVADPGTARIDADVPRRDLLVEAQDLAPDPNQPDDPLVEVTALWRADRSPAADIEISLVRPGFGVHVPPSARRVRTDEDGRARFVGVPPGSWLATATHDDAVPLLVEEGEATRAEILVEGHGTISGTVRDAAGSLVAGATIRSGGNSVPTAPVVDHTDELGRFRFRAPGPEVLVWTERGAGHSRSAEVAMTTYDGEQHEIELVVSRDLGVLQGRVVDADGRPLPGASITVLDAPPPSPSHPVPAFVDLARPVTVSDADGRFILGSLCAGTPVRWRAEAPAHVARQGSALPTQPSGNPMEIRLDRGARVSGVARTPDGRPVAGARVMRSPRDDLGIPTDGAGRFDCDGLQPGERILTARHPQYGTATRTFDLRVGERRRLDFVLEPGLAIGGRVIDSEGRPVPGVVVDRGDALTVTDPSGAFLFVDCRDRDYELTVRTRLGRVPMLLAHRDGVRPRTGPVELVVDHARHQEPGWIHGRFQRPAGYSDAPLRIRLRRAGTPTAFVVGVPDDGALVVGPLQPGRWSLQALADASPLDGFRRDEVELEPGATLDLGILRVAPPTTLTLQPEFRGGAPLPALRAVLRPIGRPGISASLTWRDGRTMPRRSIQPGNWLVEITPTDHHLGARAVVNLVSGLDNVVPIEVVAARLCRFEVVSAPHGADLGSARLTVRGAHEVADVTMRASKAGFGLPPGEYVALVEGHGFAGSTLFRVESTDGAPLRIEIPVQE